MRTSLPPATDTRVPAGRCHIVRVDVEGCRQLGDSAELFVGVWHQGLPLRDGERRIPLLLGGDVGHPLLDGVR